MLRKSRSQQRTAPESPAAPARQQGESDSCRRRSQTPKGEFPSEASPWESGSQSRRNRFLRSRGPADSRYHSRQFPCCTCASCLPCCIPRVTLRSAPRDHRNSQFSSWHLMNAPVSTRRPAQFVSSRFWILLLAKIRDSKFYLTAIVQPIGSNGSLAPF